MGYYGIRLHIRSVPYCSVLKLLLTHIFIFWLLMLRLLLFSLLLRLIVSIVVFFPLHILNVYLFLSVQHFVTVVLF